MLLDHVVFSAAADAGVRKIVLASSACTYPKTANLSGPSQTLVVSKKAQADLGWTSGVSLEEGQRRAQEHLRWIGVH
jgi:nucleoside-diphosphate-sugar epimerase